MNDVVLNGIWSKTELVLAGMVVGGVLTIGFFGWQYWMARRAYAQSLKNQTFWPPSTETWLPVSKADITRIETRRRA